MPDAGIEQTIPLDAGDLAIAAALVLAAGVASFALRLRLEWKLAIAAFRTVVQLLLIGFVLSWVFEKNNVYLVLGVACVMIIAAGHAALRRSSRTLAGGWPRAVGTLALTGLVTTVIVTGVIIGAEPWYKPRYFIPLLGMVLGNSLTGISLCLDSLLERMSEKKDEVELHLSLGATRWEAARDSLVEAARKGMIPIINAMTVVGIVSLPGMMTGQILDGADPATAVKYQIVVMFMIAGATAMGCVATVLLAYQRLFTSRHQLDTSVIGRHGKNHGRSR